MIKSLTQPLQLCALALAIGLSAACGGTSDDSQADVDAVVDSLKSAKPGEILIQGQRRERFSGPYRLKKGGYTLRFEQDGDGTLTVSLESVRGSMRDPSQLLLDDSDEKAGIRNVTVSGTFYVHVQSTAGRYVLRFTPKRNRR